MELGTCKATVSLALEAANFLNSSRQITQTEEMKAMILPILKSKEEEFRHNTQDSESQISEVDSQLQQLALKTDTQQFPDPESKDSRRELIAEIKL